MALHGYDTIMDSNENQKWRHFHSGSIKIASKLREMSDEWIFIRFTIVSGFVRKLHEI